MNDKKNHMQDFFYGALYCTNGEPEICETEAQLDDVKAMIRQARAITRHSAKDTSADDWEDYCRRLNVPANKARVIWVLERPFGLLCTDYSL